MKKRLKASPPYLELNFQYSNPQATDSLRNFSEKLIEFGAKFSGKAYQHQVEGELPEDFQFISDFSRIPIFLNSLSDLEARFLTPHSRIVELEFLNASRVESGMIESVLFGSSLGNGDPHPIVICAACDPLDEEISTSSKGAVWKARKQLVRRFIDIAKSTDSLYAAITVEYAMETPGRLKSRKSYLGFLDAYISEKHLTSDAFQQILQSIKKYGAYFEQWPGGCYYATSDWFDPNRKGIDSKLAYMLSSEIGEILGSSKSWK